MLKVSENKDRFFLYSMDALRLMFLIQNFSEFTFFDKEYIHLMTQKKSGSCFYVKVTSWRQSLKFSWNKNKLYRYLLLVYYRLYPKLQDKYHIHVGTLSVRNMQQGMRQMRLNSLIFNKSNIHAAKYTYVQKYSQMQWWLMKRLKSD